MRKKISESFAADGAGLDDDADDGDEPEFAVGGAGVDTSDVAFADSCLSLLSVFHLLPN